MTHHQHDKDEARELRPEDEEGTDASARESRSTGGDAPAAGSIAEREELARDEDVFEGPGERPGGDEDGVVGPRPSDGVTQSDAGLPGEAGVMQPHGAPESGEEEGEGPLGDIAEEVRRRRAQGQGRRQPQAEGSEGSAGKPEGGEW